MNLGSVRAVPALAALLVLAPAGGESLARDPASSTWKAKSSRVGSARSRAGWPGRRTHSLDPEAPLSGLWDGVTSRVQANHTGRIPSYGFS